MTVTLREIQPTIEDAELLVDWRNANAEWFPACEPLTLISHHNWYHTSYVTDPSQNMYMVMLDGRPVGVVGMTIRDGTGELERMILGDKSIKRGGIMRQGMRQLMDAYGLDYYWLRVMPHNEATISFHHRNGFAIIGYHGGGYTDIHGHKGEYVTMERLGGVDYPANWENIGN